MNLPRLITLLATGTLAAASTAEVVRLKDGSTREGVVRRTPDGYDVTDDQGVTVHVGAEDVRGISLTTRPVGPLEAESRLLSLRRAVDNVSDLPGIIERYAHFIEANKGSAAARDAERDLADWRDRLERHMVKVGPDWVLPAERERLLAGLAASAADARQLMLAGHPKEADALVSRGLDVNPADPAMLYLRGVTLFQADQLQPARKAFDGVAAVVRDHAPTANNIAVILWRQNQPLAALNFYVKAMTAAPNSRLVLDNVAEALNSLPAAQRTHAVVVRATKLFAQQDADLQRQMNAAGWFRWGSTWVGQVQFEKLQAIEKDVNAKLAQMSSDYDALKAKVDRLDGDVEDNLKRMRSIEQTNYATDAAGNVFRLPLPQRYFDLERDNRQLAQDRAQDVASLDGMRTAAKKLQAQVPTPRYTGVQRLIAGEGTPGLPVAAAAAPVVATTQPSAAAIAPTAEVPAAATKPTLPPLPAGIGLPSRTPGSPPTTRATPPDSLLAPG